VPQIKLLSFRKCQLVGAPARANGNGVSPFGVPIKLSNFMGLFFGVPVVNAVSNGVFLGVPVVNAVNNGGCL